MPRCFGLFASLKKSNNFTILNFPANCGRVFVWGVWVSCRSNQMTRSFYSRGLHDPYLDLNAWMLGVGGGEPEEGHAWIAWGGGVDIEFLYSCCFTVYAALQGVLIIYDLLEKIKSYSYVNYRNHISHVTPDPLLPPRSLAVGVIV